MLSAEALQMLDREREYLIPSSGRYEDAEPAVHALVRPYDIEPWRDFHSIGHLIHMSNFLLQHVYELRNPKAVLLAKNAHDMVYQPWLYDTRLETRGVNEQASALFAEVLLAPFYDPADVALVAEYVRSTAGHSTETTDFDQQYLLDADMRILGEDEDVFDAYDAGTMAEFLYDRPELKKAFMIGRYQFLSRTVSGQIYCTERAQDLYEARAKANIERTIARYALEIEQL